MATIRIVSWNIGGRDTAWRQLAADGAVDVALLQEAKAPPGDVQLEVFGAEDGWTTAEIPPDSRNVPTHRTNADDPATGQRQLDFVFASADVAEQIHKISARNRPDEWGASDHRRVVIDVQIV